MLKKTNKTSANMMICTETYNDFKQACDRIGLKYSRKTENLMKEWLKAIRKEENEK